MQVVDFFKEPGLPELVKELLNRPDAERRPRLRERNLDELAVFDQSERLDAVLRRVDRGEKRFPIRERLERNRPAEFAGLGS